MTLGNLLHDKKDRNGFIKRIIGVCLGSFLYALAINIFISPHKLLSGGVAGLALLVQYVSHIPSGYLVFILNIPVFILGLKKVDKDFVLFSMIGMMTMSIFLVVTKGISKYILMDDLVISTIFGAILSGAAMGIIFRNRASQGGTDIIAVILKNKNGFKISTMYFMLDAFIVVLGAFATNLKLTLYTVSLMYIKAVVIEKVIEGFDHKKIVMIVTAKEEEISSKIMTTIGRGTTYLYGEGGYTGKKKKIIYCLLTTRELNSVKKIVESVDDKALISISEAEEVQGRGFLKPAL
ncbi:YitT family protein [Haloimpatiens sp. FM7315]|uniref:YitT family protein n=1 Tax=Haloimpatiens sp. FM7315 TaxID=3298609 RepID=UPI0039775135